ncbi:MAG TPA: porin family protein [Flavobacterium sp.]|nr:porin family protein [Flavobacterium sp.]
MKKVILTALAVLAFGFTNAQKNVRFGLKGGLNLSTLTGDVQNAEIKPGVHIGGLVEIKLTNRFSLQPELLLSMQGAKSDYSENFGGVRYEYEDKYNLTYINVPVMAKFYVIPKLSLEAGPQLGFLVSAKNKYTERSIDGNNSSSISDTQDVKGDFATIDAGVNFGLSYYFTDNIFIQGRYSLGLTSIDDRSYNVDDNGDFDYYDDYSVQNSVLQFSFGYRF